MADHPRAVAAALLVTERLDADRVVVLRQRMQWVLFAISALGSTGYIAAVTVGTLVAADIAGSASFGGIPSSTAVIGTAVAATSLSALMLRVGRRPGLLGGLGVGVIGAVIAVVSVLTASIPLLLFGAFLSGFANGAANLGRYVAADLVPPARRATAIGAVVWGSTIGAVVGPNLVAPAGSLAISLGLPELAGAFVVTAIFIGLAFGLAFVLLRPEPYALADPSALAMRADVGPAPSFATLLRRPATAVALTSLVAGQVVMVLIMTMTPIHLIQHGHGLATVGLVLSAHTFGMFALSPISGRLTDRFGSPAVIASGFSVLGVAAVLAALAPPDGGLLLTLALFLLGWGWNLGFVAGSAMLTRGLALAERTRVQGIADALVWSSAAVAGLTSGLIVAGASYTALGFLGLALLAAPALLLVTQRARIREAIGAEA
jgi:MFS family permease